VSTPRACKCTGTPCTPPHPHVFVSRGCSRPSAVCERQCAQGGPRALSPCAMWDRRNLQRRQRRGHAARTQRLHPLGARRCGAAVLGSRMDHLVPACGRDRRRFACGRTAAREGSGSGTAVARGNGAGGWECIAFRLTARGLAQTLARARRCRRCRRRKPTWCARRSSVHRTRLPQSHACGCTLWRRASQL
jgi:hypothetical protein